VRLTNCILLNGVKIHCIETRCQAPDSG
jgi:hypothetical protein